MLLRSSVAVLFLIASIWLGLWYFIPTPPHELTIAAGIKGGAFEHIAERYKAKLARNHIILHMRFASAGETFKLAQDPNSGVSAGFLFSGLLKSDTAPELESLGRIEAAPFWIFYRGPEILERLSQLKGKRAYVTVATGDLVDRILAANGVKSGDMRVSPERGAPAAAKLLSAGEVDIAILPPIDLYAPAIQAMLRDPDTRLMNVTQAEAMARLFPSLNRLVLPQGVIDLEKNIPATDVNLIGSTTAFVVRKDLHPELKFLLAQTIMEVHSGSGVFQRAGEFPSLTDPELPMAQEALDYYRNGPSMMQRYLPFWMINYAKRAAAILLAAIAIIIPIFSFAPRIYAWFLQVYTERLYRRLRSIELCMKPDLSLTEVEGLRLDLESLSRAAHILPMRHSSLFFDLIMHMDLTRGRLGSRLTTLRGQPAQEAGNGPSPPSL